MDTAALLALYDWAPGRCFRHPELGEVETAHLKQLHPRRGPAQDVRACKACVLELETERRRAAERAGREYQPGRAGDGDE